MNEQQRLLDVIWNNDPLLLDASGFDPEGIIIYRRNLFANALRALSITFPTIFELLDSDVNEQLIRDFLKSHPPEQGDWAQWGAELSSFIMTNQLSHDYPYLPDCASLDWYMHCALHGKDQILDQTSLQILGNTDPENITINFNDNVAFIKTKYPIYEIFQAHHHNDKLQREIALKIAQEALSNEGKQHVVMVFRPEFQPQVVALEHHESEFITSLNSNKTLAESLDIVNNCNEFSFEEWLLSAINKNLIVNFANLDSIDK